MTKNCRCIYLSKKKIILIFVMYPFVYEILIKNLHLIIYIKTITIKY